MNVVDNVAMDIRRLYHLPCIHPRYNPTGGTMSFPDGQHNEALITAPSILNLDYCENENGTHSAAFHMPRLLAAYIVAYITLISFSYWLQLYRWIKS